MPLHGAHQGDNASIALTAAEAFFAAPLGAGRRRRGLRRGVVPGRFEVLGYQPLVIVDGAHNPPGADTCAQVFFDDFHPEGRRILVVGTLREPTAMLEALRADEFDVVVACTAPSPRGVPSPTSPAPPSTSAATRCSPPTPSARPARSPCDGADGDDAILAAGSLTSPAPPARPSSTARRSPPIWAAISAIGFWAAIVSRRRLTAQPARRCGAQRCEVAADPVRPPSGPRDVADT